MPTCAARVYSAPFIRKSLTPALSQREREQEESPPPSILGKSPGGEGKGEGGFTLRYSRNPVLDSQIILYSHRT